VDLRVTYSRSISVNFSCVREPRTDLGSPRGDTFSATGFGPGRNPRFPTHTRIVQADDCSPGLCKRSGNHSGLLLLGLHLGDCKEEDLWYLRQTHNTPS